MKLNIENKEIVVIANSITALLLLCVYFKNNINSVLMRNTADAAIWDETQEHDVECQKNGQKTILCGVTICMEPQGAEIVTEKLMETVKHVLYRKSVTEQERREEKKKAYDNNNKKKG